MNKKIITSVVASFKPKVNSPYVDIINTIKQVVKINNNKLVENKFTKRSISSSSFVHISKTCLENNKEYKELKELSEFKNLNFCIQFYPSMFNYKYGIQYVPKNNQINIYLD